MRIESAAALLSPLIPLDQASDTLELDWMRAFTLARVGALAAVIGLTPLALVASPQVFADVLGLFVALVASAAAGLLALRSGGPFAGAMGGLIALGAVAIGPWPAFGAEAAALAMLATAGLEAAALPAASRQKRWLLAVGVIMAATLAIFAWGLARYEGSTLWHAGLPLLVLPALLTLVFSLWFARARLKGEAISSGLSERREETLLAGAGVAALLVDRGGHVLDCTRSAGELLKCHAGDVAGRGLFDRLPIAERPAYLKTVSDVSAYGGVADLTVRLREGVPLPPTEGIRFSSYRLTIRRVREASGATAAIRLEPAAAPGDADVRSAETEDAELLRVVSHEIRTPMHTILGFADVLAATGAAQQRPDQINDYARIIHRAAREAYAVSNALVALMNARAPSVRLDPQSVDMQEVIVSAARNARQRIRDRSAIIDVETPAGDAAIETDLHAASTLIGALVEGFSVAFDGRAHVRCSLSRAGLDLVVAVTARENAAVVSIHREGQAGSLGVMSELAARLASALGARARLDLAGPEISARIEFPRAWSMPSPAATTNSVSTPFPLRLSA
jgi:cell cycle sensor histidine kinase DivJ